MACAEYRSLLPRYADGELSPAQVRLLRDHLPECDSCRRTLRLLRMEDEAIRSAFLAAAACDRPSGSPRLVRAALAATLVLAVSLLGLYGVYRALPPVLPVAEQAASERNGPPLQRPVLVSARGEPLPDYLRRVSGAAGVEIRIAPSARSTLAVPRVDLPLVKAIRLRSVLELLSRFFGLSYRVEGETIILE